MLQKCCRTIGVDSIEDLFDEIPATLRCGDLNLPDALNEAEITRLMEERAAQDAGALCFIGAGAYQHHIPAAVWQIATRGECDVDTHRINILCRPALPSNHDFPLRLARRSNSNPHNARSREIFNKSSMLSTPMVQQHFFNILISMRNIRHDY